MSWVFFFLTVSDKLFSSERVCNFIRSVQLLSNILTPWDPPVCRSGLWTSTVLLGEAFFFSFLFFRTMSTRTTKCVFFNLFIFYFIFTHDPQLPVPSGASRTHKNTQNRSLFVFPAPIDETVSASYHSVLSFNLLLFFFFFFSFLLSLSFFQPRTSNQPALRDRLRAVSSNIRRNKHRYPHFSGFSQLFCVFKRFCLAKHVLIVFCFVFFSAKKMPKRVSQ